MMNLIRPESCPVPFIRRQGKAEEIGLFRLHAFGEKFADIPDLGYPRYRDVQFGCD
jgi:hypothetical protein